MAGELSRLGYIASLTLRNTKGIDIQVSNYDGTKYIGIQVKTNHKDRRKWLVGKKAEENHAKNLYYILVNLKDNEHRPDYYIVPCEVVAKQVKETFQRYMNTVGRKPRQAGATMRDFWDKGGEYLERWDIIHNALSSD